MAAVLASAYDYDKQLNEDVSANSETSSRGSFAYLDYADDDHEGDDNVGNDDETDVSFGYTKSSAISNTSSSLDEASDVDSTREHGSSRSQKAGRNNNNPSPSVRPQPTTTWGSKKENDKAERAIQRTRRRRYELCCELLISSSELLLLEKGVARGFLPMLSRILVPSRWDGQHSNATKSTGSGLPPRSQSAATMSGSAPPSPGERIRRPSVPPQMVDRYNTQHSEATMESWIDTEKSTDTTENKKEYESEELDKEDVLRPFLESMTPGSGFRCLSMLLLQHLLTSKVGYDARIRHVVKKLGVIVLLHDMGTDPIEHELFHGTEGGDDIPSFKAMMTHATRKFESLERSIARRLIRLSKTSQDTKGHKANLSEKDNSQDEGLTKEKIMRGLKIGSAGVVAGTLFAVTGGLAAPQIAMGVSAFLGSTAVATVAVSVLTHAAVVSTIFGVGGGGLAAYKMQRRTQGLTEFEFRKESGDRLYSGGDSERNGKMELDAELFTTVCISGWLRDNHDYQRPWGLHPTRPRLVDRLELLERFYSIHRPDHLPNCPRVLADWKGEEKNLWSLLREKYGSDPDHLFPLNDGPRLRGSLTLDQEEVLDAMFVELGLNSVDPKKPLSHVKDSRTPFERMRETLEHQRQKMAHWSVRNVESGHGPSATSNIFQNPQSEASRPEGTWDRPKKAVDTDEYEVPKHLATVWDYSTTYGGELYTVRWESLLLKTICDCVMDLAMDVVSGATREILKATILSTLLTAVVLPSYLLNAANMIDGDWTLAVERADQAGEELARSLLLSRAGQRPVTLIGFSFGARIIYACLKELAKLQEEWEDYHGILDQNKELTPSEQRYFAKLDSKFKGMREPASIVEDAVIMGLPNHLSLASWKACRQVVGGRLVNCYSNKDLILSLMFQAKRFSPGIQTILKPVCGTCEVSEPGVENIDVSDLVLGHQDYCLHTGKILERVKLGEPLRQRRGKLSFPRGTTGGETGPFKASSSIG